jgi:hypothetical protein
MRLRRTGFFLILLLGLPSGGALAQAANVAAVLATDMAAHHAMYALTLQSAHGDVVAASGSMAYEVADACDAWTTRQRMKLTVTNRDGQDTDMVSDYATWESKDGLRLRFRMRQTTDDAVTSDLVGQASLQRLGGPGEVHYSEPKDSTIALPAGTLFPMVHTATVLAAAEAGKKLLELPLFDGTGPDGAQNTSVVITSWTGPRPDPWPELAKLPSGRVRVAFFDRTPDSLLPDYEVGMRYWENGVADDLSMDFGDFVMLGRLTTFNLLPRHGC